MALDPIPEEDKKVILWGGRLILLLGLILWFSLIYFLKWYEIGIIGWVILALPVVIFIVALATFTPEDLAASGYLFQEAIATILVAVSAYVLSSWSKGIDMTDVKQGQRPQTILLMSIGITVISYLDTWIPAKYIILARLFKMVLQTIGLSLAVLALYKHFEIINNCPGDSPGLHFTDHPTCRDVVGSEIPPVSIIVTPSDKIVSPTSTSTTSTSTSIVPPVSTSTSTSIVPPVSTPPTTSVSNIHPHDPDTEKGVFFSHLAP